MDIVKSKTWKGEAKDLKKEMENLPWSDRVITLPKEKLKELARDILEGRVFTTQHIHDFKKDASSVFLAIGLGCFKNAKRSFTDDIGMVYEYLSKAGPISANGYPTFMSLQVVSRADLDLVNQYHNKLKEAQEKAMKELDD